MVSLFQGHVTNGFCNMWVEDSSFARGVSVMSSICPSISLVRYLSHWVFFVEEVRSGTHFSEEMVFKLAKFFTNL